MSDRHRSEPTLDEELTRLILHGRDREAASLAVDRLPRATGGNPMDPRTQIDTIFPVLTDLVASIDDDQLDAPTPCAQFAVRDVLAHMVGGATMFAAAFRGKAPATLPEDVDVVAAFPGAMNDLQEALHTPGALDRTIQAPFGDVPGEAFARFVALDGVVHGWDIATATGQPYDPPAALVEEVDAFARQALSDDMRDGDTFAAATGAPADASPLVRLVAFTGRRV